MITLFDQFNDTQLHDENQELIDHTVQEYLGSFERRMICFESSWQDDLYKKQSISGKTGQIDHPKAGVN